MIKVNANFCKLTPSYLFSDVARKIAKFHSENPSAEVIRMSIGDVTQPICPAAIKALHDAVEPAGLRIHIPRLRARTGL